MREEVFSFQFEVFGAWGLGIGAWGLGVGAWGLVFSGWALAGAFTPLVRPKAVSARHLCRALVARHTLFQLKSLAMCSRRFAYDPSSATGGRDTQRGDLKEESRWQTPAEKSSKAFSTLPNTE